MDEQTEYVTDDLIAYLDRLFDRLDTDEVTSYFIVVNYQDSAPSHTLNASTSDLYSLALMVDLMLLNYKNSLLSTIKIKQVDSDINSDQANTVDNNDGETDEGSIH